MINHKKGIQCAFGSVIAFSLVSPVAKYLMLTYPEMSFEWLVQVRMTIAAIFFVAYNLIRDRNALKVSGKKLALMISIGAIGIFGVQYGIFAALQTITIAVATFIQDTSTIFVCLFSFIFLKEELTKDKAAGLALGILGMVIIFYTPDVFNQGMTIIGLLWAFSTTIAKVYYSIVTKLINVPAHVTLAYGFSAGAILSWCFKPAQTIVFLKANAGDIKFVGLVLFLGLFGTALSFFLYMQSINLTYLSTAGLITMCIPVMATVISYLALGEMVTIKDGIGCALIFFGIVVVQIRASFRDREKEQVVS